MSLKYRIVTAIIGAIAVLLPSFGFADDRRAIVEGGSDQLFLEVSGRVAGFGGAYVDDDGMRYVWLTDPSELGLLDARSALAQQVGGDFAVGTYVARHATYSFIQLSSWHERMVDVLALNGVILTDINERTNRLTIGVEDADASSEAVEAEIRRVGVPLEAVEIKEMSPFGLASSLTDSHRPMVGGLQIEGQAGPAGIGSVRQCSLGVITIRSSFTGFVNHELSLLANSR